MLTSEVLSIVSVPLYRWKVRDLEREREHDLGVKPSSVLRKGHWGLFLSPTLPPLWQVLKELQAFNVGRWWRSVFHPVLWQTPRNWAGPYPIGLWGERRTGSQASVHSFLFFPNMTPGVLLFGSDLGPSSVLPGLSLIHTPYSACFSSWLASSHPANTLRCVGTYTVGNYILCSKWSLSSWVFVYKIWPGGAEYCWVLEYSLIPDLKRKSPIGFLWNRVG